MTDTAQPLPSENSDAKTADGALSREQLRRATALDVARATLISRTGLFGGQQVGPTFDVQDLIIVAEWVLNEPLALANPDAIMKAASLSVTEHDASNKAYFDSGWEAVRNEALRISDQKGATAATDWLIEHPAGGRLIDGQPVLSTPGPSGWWTPIDDAQAAHPDTTPSASPLGAKQEAEMIDWNSNKEDDAPTGELPSYPEDSLPQ
jgi:hypothetical protein